MLKPPRLARAGEGLTCRSTTVENQSAQGQPKIKCAQLDERYQTGRRAAVLISLIASCKDNRVEPWAYLRDLFTRLPLTSPASEEFAAVLESFLPDRWHVAHPQHR